MWAFSTCAPFYSIYATNFAVKNLTASQLAVFHTSSVITIKSSCNLKNTYHKCIKSFSHDTLSLSLINLCSCIMMYHNILYILHILYIIYILYLTVYRLHFMSYHFHPVSLPGTDCSCDGGGTGEHTSPQGGDIVNSRVALFSWIA